MESRASKLNSITREQQHKLAEFSKTGLPQEGLKLSRPENLEHYRRLVFNVTFDILSTAYPISRKLLDRKWKGMVELFMKNHACSNNQVWKMPKEFFEYVQQNPLKEKQEFPFLTELLWFEWLEIELYSQEDKPIGDFKKSGNWLKNSIAINPHHKLVQFKYPVFRPLENLNRTQTGNFYLLLLRDNYDLKVKFIEVSELYYFTLQRNSNNFRESLLEVSRTRYGILDEELVLKKAQPTVELFFQKGLFLGYC